ncbi:prepilin-type N-terminal cleavage/methylation domain-containing protein [Fimbriimonas ginsengisoli]|uniref:Prepilin-type N-terminal cleavage/methylation domain-containing protein n=1 Tax=Fimbriimonas ginsengisoli Gsoil 348 TaxID=661478 RepID=A0A068NMX7_FIMGI|nr:prepilin-type N-terminal cleavage/methylation domain-containing protein [Fimbriimonas ginsengisoli]AIE84070.1 hypothetical protein OP10G_0702 [Fimbriimonas ginsengisoli Gsoil 348]
MPPITKKSRRRGFTLVELLVVVLIISTLMSVALPLYVSALSDSSKKTCRHNMESIVNAAQAWKTKNRVPNFSTLTASALLGDLGQIPRCPDGGTYTITASGTVNDSAGVATTIPANGIGITCSTVGHNGYIPGLMGR